MFLVGRHSAQLDMLACPMQGLLWTPALKPLAGQGDFLRGSSVLFRNHIVVVSSAANGDPIAHHWSWRASSKLHPPIHFGRSVTASYYIILLSRNLGGSG